MAKRKLSFGDYQEPTWEEYTGEDPPIGKWFTGEVTRGKYLEDDDQMMFIVEITDPDSPFKGWGRGWYAPWEGEQKWKFHALVKALQGGKTTDVEIDWENEKALAAWLKKQKPIKFKTGTYNDRVKIDRVAPLMEAVPTAAGKKAAPVVEVEPDVDDALEDYTEEELGEKNIDELKDILGEEFEADVPKKLRKESADEYKDKIIDAILDAQDEANEEEGDPDQEAAEPAADEESAEEGDEFDDGFEGDEEDDGEEEEEEPAPAPPARRARASKSAPARAAAPAATRRRRG